ncbi:MAG: sugar phosphate isomerase/epimerase [Ruminococcaceae bacterium]|nr:sugar phosphate isomerase/epimerase [Oscillospiraceae bacterium]
MRTAISSYSFQRAINRGEESQLSVIAKAKAMGLDAIEFIDLCPPEGVSEEDYATKLREEAAKEGIAIAAYTVAADLLREDLDAEIERVCRKVDVAVLLGAPLLRHDATFQNPPEGWEAVLPRLAEGCRRITEYAAARGVRTMVENHGFFCQDSVRVEALCRAVAHENFGLLVDTGNFLCVDESSEAAVTRCAPYAFHVHIKDFLFKSAEEGVPSDGWIVTRGGNFLRGTVAGHGVVPIARCVAALKAAGYDGTVSLEFEGWENLDDALPHGVAFLKKVIA